MDPYNIVNKLNFMCATVSMMMMDDKEGKIGVLIDSDIQQMESSLSNMTIITGNMLSNDSI